MSGSIPSAFGDPNVLYKNLSGETTQAFQQNQLAISDHDIALTGQAAAPLLGMSEEDAARAYPDVIRTLQAAGGGKFAPSTYPGHAATQALVQRAMPLMDQFKTGYITPPGTQAAIDAALRPGTTAPPATTSTGGGGGTNAPPGTSTPTTPQNLADIHPDLTQFTLPSGVGVTVAKSAAPQFQGLLTDLEAAGYKLDPNTTGGYNPRTIAGTNTPSQHAYGLALDVNWQRNPRGANTPADIPPDLARKLAAKWGLTWGGDWQGADRDPMHFEVARGTGPGTDHPAGVATGWNANNPLNLTADTGGVVTPGGARLASFGSMADGVAATAAKLQSYQTDRGLDTVRKIYAEWHKGSPVNEADMQRIAGAIGVGVDQPVQLDPTKTAAWITAAQPGETGTAGKRLSPADIAAGVRQAFAAPPAAPGGVAARTGGTDVAGPGAGSGGAPGQPAAMPRDQAVAQAQRSGQAVPVAGVDGLWALPNGNLSSTPPTAQPAAQPQAQVPQPPANRVMPGGADGPPAPPPPTQPGARANLPRAADVPTGVNSQQYRDAADLQRRALILEAQVDPTGRLKQLAAGLRQQAQLLLQTDSVVQTQEGQLHPLTGQIGDPTKPLPHYVYDPTQHAYIDTTGTNKPEFQPAQRDTAIAQRDVMELGPKVANGTATPEEVAQYNVAATTYQQFKDITDPVTKQIKSVPTRPLPDGLPQPPGTGGRTLTEGVSPAQQQIARDPATYENQRFAYQHDVPIIDATSAAGRTAQQSALQLNELADVIKGIKSGGILPEFRAKAAALLEGAGASKETIQSLTGMSSGSDAQVMQKLAVATLGQAAKTDLGSNVGVESLNLYAQANPGMDKLQDANIRVTNMTRVARALIEDYTRGAQQHFNDNQAAFLHPKAGQPAQYTPLSEYNANWQAANNPQVGAGTMGILNGDDYGHWAGRLQSPAEQFRAVELAVRVDPNVVVQTAAGPRSGKDILAHSSRPGSP